MGSTTNAEFKCVLALIRESIKKDEEVDQDVQVRPRRQRGDHHRRSPLEADGGEGRAPLPGDQRERLRDQVEVRQRLRVPPLAHGWDHACHRRHAWRQALAHPRLRRRRQGQRRCAPRVRLPRAGDGDRSDQRAPGVHGGLRGDTIEKVVGEIDIFVSTTGNFNIITCEHMKKMKNNAIVGNIGHFDNEIDMAGLEAVPGIKVENIKAQVDRYVLPDGKGIIVLASGRLLNLGCATGHPSFVMSCSFTNQTLAQLELWKERDSGKYKTDQVYLLPKNLDEKVARLHLPALGAELTVLSKEQADYIDVPVGGPYKPDTYRY